MKEQWLRRNLATKAMIVINWLCEIFEGAAFHHHFIQGPRLAFAVEAVNLGHNH